MRLEYLAAESADPELQALDVGDRLHFLAEEAAHLRAGVTAREIDDVVLRIELAHQLHAVAFEHPRRHLARVQAERDCAAQCEHRVLAEEVVRRGMRDLDGRVLHAVDDTEGRHQLAGGMRRDLELAPSHVAHLLREHLGRAEDRVERLGEARSQAPPYAGLRMNDSRCNPGGNDAGNAGIAYERATLHSHFSCL